MANKLQKDILSFLDKRGGSYACTSNTLAKPQNDMRLRLANARGKLGENLVELQTQGLVELEGFPPRGITKITLIKPEPKEVLTPDLPEPAEHTLADLAPIYSASLDRLDLTYGALLRASESAEDHVLPSSSALGAIMQEVGLSRYSAKSSLDQLRDMKFVTKVGDKRGTKYQTSHDPEHITLELQEYVSQPALIVQVASPAEAKPEPEPEPLTGIELELQVALTANEAYRRHIETLNEQIMSLEIKKEKHDSLQRAVNLAEQTIERLNREVERLKERSELPLIPQFDDHKVSIK